MAGDVPARPFPRLGKERTAARHIFFGTHGIKLIGNFVALARNRQQTNAMHGTYRWTQLREFDPKLEPSEVSNIKQQKESEKHKRQIAEGQVPANWQGSWHSRG